MQQTIAQKKEQKPDALVFFDLDGTLLNSKRGVAQSSVNAITELKRNNIIPILATGRTRCEMEHVMHKVGIHSIVGMNGQIVSYEGELIFENSIDPKLIQRVLEFSREQKIAISFYNESIMRISEKTEMAIKNYAHLRQEVPSVDDLIYQKEAIQMLLLLCDQGEEVFYDVFPELTFIRNTLFCVDVFNKGGSKAFGIQKLIENKGFFDVPTYAFGDGMNDLEMFQLVDYSIAMENANPSLKEYATFVTDHHDRDGIAKGLRQFNLI